MRDEVRTAVSALRLRAQRKLHWRAENDQRRKLLTAAELLRRRDVEQEARFAYLDARDRGEEPDWAPVRAIDQDNLAFLIEVIGRHGWLGSDLVGPDGASAC